MYDIKQIILNETLNKPKYTSVTIGENTVIDGEVRIFYSSLDLPNGYFKVNNKSDKRISYILDRVNHRTEKDPKTGLTKWAVKAYNFTSEQYTYEWWINGVRKRIDKHPNGVSYPNVVNEQGTQMWRNERGNQHRDEKDPNTGLSLPSYITTDGYCVWEIDNKNHRIDGPAVSYDKRYTPSYNKWERERYDKYYLDDKELSKEEWEKDPRVQRVLALKAVEDTKTSDDDFLRSFGKIV